jgi:hypothetical protein
MKFIEARLKGYILKDDQAARHPDGQTNDVDRSKTFAVKEISPSDLQIILEHGRGLCKISSLLFARRVPLEGYAQIML